MLRPVTAMAAAVILSCAAEASAQNCDLSGPNSVQTSCSSPIASGSSSVCTLSITNGGAGDCVGNWTSAIGTFDPGTVSGVQATGVFGACSFVGDVPLPSPLAGFSTINSAWACHGSGALHPNETTTMTARVSPNSSFTGNSFFAGYLTSFRSTPGSLGTTGIDAYGSLLISLQNCTATPSAAGSSPSGVPYVVSWNSTSGASSSGGYEIQEATLADFSNALTLGEPSTSRQFQHTVTSPTVFYYRVRPLTCGGSSGSFGSVAQIVILPPQPPTSRDFDLVVPLGSTTQVSQDVTFTGLTPGAAFSVSTDKAYLTVTPATGTVRSDGTVTVTVRGNPSDLPVGANTGTILISVTTGKGSPSPNDTTTTGKTVSISLVTPVTAVPKGAPPADALIVPAVAHLEGIVPFRSDVRITNAGTAAATYLLSFTPQNTDGTTSGRQTTITVQPDQTVALNDVLRDFFGFALASDQAGGVLDIRVIVGSAATTFVSSRTYAATSAGTYGQFVPAVPLGEFLKAGGTPLTLIQVSQNDAFRTNIGLLEGLGAPVSGRLRVFDPLGSSLGEFPFSLRAFEFTQLGSFLASKGITAADARIEAVVDSTTGGLSTYASVLDQRTQDPLLVSPLPAASIAASRWVLPGMADFDNGLSNFHSDVRIFNASPFSVSATATFYPQGANSTPTIKFISIAPGEIKAYNNVLPTLFGLSGGGAIVITTPVNAALIVSGRTYSNDAKSGGTFGQFIPAVTPVEGIGLGDSPLQVLQLEQSINFRSNLGLNELTGNPVTVRVAAVFPDSKVSPSTDVPLAPNEFRQLGSILSQLNPGVNTYNGRITVRVIAGTGRVTAYGSVVDNLTSDPTFVPAQK